MTQRDIDPQARNPILDHLERGTLVRDWGDGHQRASLYTALVPGAVNSDDCPSHIMPQWLADLTAAFTHRLSPTGWEKRMRRYGTNSARWHSITDEGWDCVERSLDRFCKRLACEYRDQPLPASLSDEAKEAIEFELRSLEGVNIRMLQKLGAPYGVIEEANWTSLLAICAAFRAAVAANDDEHIAASVHHPADLPVAGVDDLVDLALAGEGPGAAAWDRIFDELMLWIEVEILVTPALDGADQPGRRARR